MIELPGPLVLASGSPRRSDLLGSIGLDFLVRPPHIDESVLPGETPTDYVLRLARAKASAVAVEADAAVLAADTTVELDGVALGKPVDDLDAARMLRLLGGRTHHVHTGVSVVVGSARRTRLVTTAVTFVPLHQTTIDWYVGTGEPTDKAGGYAIQGAGAVLVERVDGSVSNVIGLPLAETVAELRAVVAAGCSG